MIGQINQNANRVALSGEIRGKFYFPCASTIYVTLLNKKSVYLSKYYIHKIQSLEVIRGYSVKSFSQPCLHNNVFLFPNYQRFLISYVPSQGYGVLITWIGFSLCHKYYAIHTVLYFATLNNLVHLSFYPMSDYT